MNRLLTPQAKESFLASWHREKGLSGNALKMIACVLMFFDHMSQGVALNSLGFMPTGVTTSWGIPVLWGIPTASLLATIATLAGRIAFPIFCFFLVQGVLLSGDYKKQIQRLLLFALIAEVPFDLGLFGQVFYWDHQNVLFELALGAVTIVGMKKILDGDKKGKRSYAAWLFIAAAILAEILKFDYGASGIIAMVLLYLACNDRRRTMFMGLFAFFFEAPLYGTVYLSLPLIYQYNGKRGRGERWFFYIFYPAHLMALYLLSLWI